MQWSFISVSMIIFSYYSETSHLGYLYSRDTSSQGSPFLVAAEHFHIIFVVVTVVPLLKGHLYSGERETLPGSQNPVCPPFREHLSIQKVTVHKNVNKFKCSLVTIATAFKPLTTLLKSMHCTCENSTHNIAEVS